MQRMKAAEFTAIALAREQGKPSRKGRARGPNKYGAVRTEVNGHRFDSKAEAAHYATLCGWERAGLIRDLRLQVPFALRGPAGPLLSEAGNPLTYRADFVYFDVAEGRDVVVDVKGAKTSVYKLKKAIMAQMGLPITEVSVK